jgi:hypothetical protein
MSKLFTTILTIFYDYSSTLHVEKDLEKLPVAD